MLEQFQDLARAFADLAWGPWLLVLLLGGGGFFLVYMRFAPFRHMDHAVDILRGKFDSPDDPGDITHFQALSSALAGTIGMGNIAGVAQFGRNHTADVDQSGNCNAVGVIQTGNGNHAYFLGLAHCLAASVLATKALAWHVPRRRALAA